MIISRKIFTHKHPAKSSHACNLFSKRWRIAACWSEHLPCPSTRTPADDFEFFRIVWRHEFSSSFWRERGVNWPRDKSWCIWTPKQANLLFVKKETMVSFLLSSCGIFPVIFFSGFFLECNQTQHCMISGVITVWKNNKAFFNCLKSNGMPSHRRCYLAYRSIWALLFSSIVVLKNFVKMNIVMNL